MKAKTSLALLTEKLARAQSNLVLKPARAIVFATVMAEFGSQTVLDFKSALKRAFKRKTGRTGRWAIALSHYEWSSFMFFFNQYRELLVTQYGSLATPVSPNKQKTIKTDSPV